MSNASVVRLLPGILICLSFLPLNLESQTGEVSSPRLSAEADTKPAHSLRATPLSALRANLPLQFEENIGQADSRARFLARGAATRCF